MWKRQCGFPPEIVAGLSGGVGQALGEDSLLLLQQSCTGHCHSPPCRGWQRALYPEGEKSRNPEIPGGF